MRDRSWVWAGGLACVLALGVAALVLEQRRQFDQEAKRLMLAPITRGMGTAAVRRALGPPASVEPKGHFTIPGERGRCGRLPVNECWVYRRSSFHRLIYFDADGKVVCDAWVIIDI